MKGEDREDEWRYRTTIHDLGNRCWVAEIMPCYLILEKEPPVPNSWAPEPVWILWSKERSLVLPAIQPVCSPLLQHLSYPIYVPYQYLLK